MDKKLREIGLSVNRRMDEMKLTPVKIAKIAKISHMTVYSIVKGNNHDMKSLLKVLDVLKLKIKLQEDDLQ